ncbi:hypothetical protein C0Q70_01144 [Pomacea canaliculata]|uniref:Uncharacterized protein n=1 Tax=Pomacea canaliculata TaxID=400727 RepID=A0A2T7PYQ1_POMCA|nr:coiled-coil domain-containing protein 137-like [Pomacea canaliculata]PVD38528.1 hypothetical protein C0Q70_01144 [Pomacea canaliculata]
MGKISKPQKSKKHKKIKFVDPFYHGERKERMFAGRDNAPENLDQEVPRRFKELIRNTKQAAELKKKSRKQKREIIRNMKKAQDLNTCLEPMPQAPVFQKEKGETNKAFMNRVNMETKEVIKESQLEKKYRIDRTSSSHKEDEGKSKKKEKLKLRKQAKKEREKEKKQAKTEDFDKFQDKVEFGEVVHAPPIIKTLPRKANQSDKPWVKSLLLKDNLLENSASSHQLGKCNLRKNLSPGQQLKMDSLRQSVIDLYRQNKKT